MYFLSMKIGLVTLMSMFLFFTPYITSLTETHGNLHLIVVCGLKRNGYIDIDRNNQKVKYYLPFGLGRGCKGMTDLGNATFSYKNTCLVMVHNKNRRIVFKVKCSRNDIEIISSFLKCTDKQIIED